MSGQDIMTEQLKTSKEKINKKYHSFIEPYSRTLQLSKRFVKNNKKYVDSKPCKKIIDPRHVTILRGNCWREMTAIDLNPA